MRRSPKTAEAVRAESSSPAFAGLGHALSAVARVATRLTVLRAPAPQARRLARIPEPVRGLSGYGLLVTLGREIRGR